MKKILFVLLAVVAALVSSCSNDEIEISQSTTFKIDPSTVISTYTYEFNAGELDGLYSGYSLRVRLLVYDAGGTLVTSETQYVSNYAVTISTAADLASGDYTAVAITDAVELEDDAVSFEYWELSDEQQLATTTITDCGYIGGMNKVLGIGYATFSLSEGEQQITIKPAAAGSLFCLLWDNIHTYSDIEYIGLMTNRTGESLVLDDASGYDVSIDYNSGSYDWWVDYIAPSDYPSYDAIYDYCFDLPMKNKGFEWYCIDSDGYYYEIGDAMTFSTEAGSQYYFYIDMEELSCYGMDITGYTASSAKFEKAIAPGTAPVQKDDDKSSMKVIDFIQAQ